MVVVRDMTLRTCALLMGIFFTFLLSACSNALSPKYESGDILDSGSSRNEPAPTSPELALGISGSSVITTIWIYSTATDPVQAAEAATQIATELGGYVESRSESIGLSEPVPIVANSAVLGSSATSVTVTLRVPTQNLDRALEDLKLIGRVTSFNQSQYDAAADQANLEAQIETLEASLVALRELQTQASNVPDLLQAEQAISERQATLNGLLAQQDYLTTQLDMTSVSMTFTEQISAQINQQTFWDGLVNGWNSLLSGGGVLLVAAGFLLPWVALIIVMAALTFAVVWGILRISGRRKADRKKPAVRSHK